MFGKKQKGNSRQQFENRNRLVPIGFCYPFYCIGKSVIINKFAATLLTQPVTLVPMNKMGRCMDMNTVSGTFEKRTASCCR